jgi:radical SAM superfamily enzyme YgiQ (UPF0313 family)
MEKWSVIKHYRDILESEDGYIIKNGSIKVALLYPNTYDLASQNLGFQEAYRFLNSIDNVVCERFVLDFYEDNLSLESQKFLAEFDILFISINYEEDILNLLKFLKSQHIDVFREARDDSFPLIIAGGVLTFLNPVLLLDIVDFQLVGDLEPMKEDLVFMLKLKTKNERISFIKTLDYSVYPERNGKAKVAYKKDRRPICSVIKTSKGEFAGEFLAELSIGCKYGCRFCSASYIYRPYRIMDFDIFYDIVKKNSFGNQLGIISAVFGDLPDIKSHLTKLKNLGKNVSVSSLRIDTLDEDLVALLKDCGVNSITIAEETVSEKLKKVINKNIDSSKIYDAVKIIAEKGILNLKLYYMIGLPGETIQDIMLMVERIQKISSIFTKIQSERFKRVGKIKVSINIFIPKPFTPMQYFGIENKKSISNKIKYLNSGLRKIPNLNFNIMSHNTAFLQATISRGNSSINEFYRLYVKNYDVKHALKAFDSNAYNMYDISEEFEWEKLISHNFDLKVIRNEFLKIKNFLEN